MDEEIFGRMRGPMDEDGFFNPTDLSFLTQPTEQAPVAPPPAPTPAAQPVVPTAPAPSPAPALSALPQGWQETFLTGGLDAGGEGPSGATEEAKHELDEELARRLGFTGTFANYTDLGIELTPEAREFQRQIAEKGYRVAGINAGDKFYTTVFDQSGKALVEPTFREIPDDRLFGLVSNILSAAAGNVMAGGLTAAGMPSALAKGASSYIFSGGDPKAALAGGLGSLASPYIGQVAKAASEAVGGGMLGDIASRAISGAGTSAIGSAVRGGDIGDIGEALLSGGLGGAAGAVSSGLTKDLPLPEPVTRVLNAALTSAMLGRDVEGATTNAILGEIIRGASTPGDRRAGESALSKTSFLNPDEILAEQLPEARGPDIDVVEALLGGVPFSGTDNVLKDLPPMPLEDIVAAPVEREQVPVETLAETIAPKAETPVQAPVQEPMQDMPIFLGENAPSGVPEWDTAAAVAGLPVGNLEQDFVIAQQPEGPVIQDIAGNIGQFIEEDWMPRADILDFVQAQTGGVPIFLGENVPSGVPEWDTAAAMAGLPIGNLEQDFVVAQRPEGPVIEDTAGNRGEFINGEWVVRSDPRDFSDYVAPPPPPAAAPAPAPSRPSAPAPAPAPKASSFDPALLALLGAAMTRQEKEEDRYQVADVRGARSPFGSLFGEPGTQADLLRILRG